ncbi:acyl-CoA thioesterase [Corynebacterium uterequi]|uniref:Putative thioesterase n=1 Tax=Corynebacterium uterequi TaxID=1072256 RepID=A0A0G3HG26_9CORY|nr:putative thioesterase [Corynebacterium uterequi]
MSTHPRNVHTMTVPVRWSDFDRYGHVMNANYIEFAQEARLAFAQEHFYNQGHPFAAYVRRLEVDFFRPIQPDTREVTVETFVADVGDTSFTTRQEIKDRQGKTTCVVTCVQVTMDLATQAPRSLTEKEVMILTRAPQPPALDAAVDDEA